MIVTFATYNPMDLYRREEEVTRFTRIEQIIRDLQPDVIAVQELPGHNRDQAIRGICRLGEATGMICSTKKRYGFRPAYATTPGNHNELGLGFLWRPGIELVPGTVEVIKDGFWHALLMATFDIGGIQVRHACYHAPPRVGREVSEVEHERMIEAHHVVSALAAPMAHPLGIIGGDWNSMSADFVGSEFYDPFPTMSDETDPATARLIVSRTQGEVLRMGGLFDAAVHVQPPAEWQATVGHWPKATHGYRRIDIVRVTRRMVPALRSHRVVDTPLTREVSDHLPVIVEYDTAALV